MTQSANVSRSRPLKLGQYTDVPPEAHPDLNKLRLAIRDEINQLRSVKDDQARFNKRVFENLAEYLVQAVEAILVTNVVHEAGILELNKDVDELGGDLEEMEEKMGADGLSIEEAQIIVSAVTQLVGIVKAVTPQNPEDAETIRKALEAANEALEIVTPYTQDDDDGSDDDDDDGEEGVH